jgi:hypothetical protein
MFMPVPSYAGLPSTCLGLFCDANNSMCSLYMDYDEIRQRWTENHDQQFNQNHDQQFNQYQESK